VIVKVAATHGATVPAWLPRTAIDPAEFISALFKAAVIVGSPVVDPLTHITKDPKLARFAMFVAVLVIAIGKAPASLLLTVNAISSYRRLKYGMKRSSLSGTIVLGGNEG